ncbi:MAG: nucleoside triphosphate pyrophosphohydrolase [Clostridia bacterium]|nr:nucleoside triphosphate pyrophosphohydrolase [Clostridia bacterium]
MSVESLLKKESYTPDDLREIMELLRAENGCPWDREQDHKSIRNNFIEEVYEVIEGIDTDNDDIIKEELGDVLLQVVFHARIAEEAGKYNLDDVADGICKKLILRHPHIFSDVKVENSAEVLKNWDEIKKKEKSQRSVADTLKGVSASLPALVRASKIKAKACKVGFEYPSVDGAVEKVAEEFDEVKAEIASGNSERVSEEIGDLLFAVANLARMCGVNAEEALYNTNNKFVDRFEKMENLATENGQNLALLNISEKIELWNKAKNL